jgi:hypothetical protein
MAAVACPPPPPPLPTIEDQARGFWNTATEACVFRLVAASRTSSDLPELRLQTLADAYWQIDAVAMRALKGQCASGRVYFAEISPALCGGGMPPFDTNLLVAMTSERVLLRWTDPDGDLAVAVGRYGVIGAGEPGP